MLHQFLPALPSNLLFSLSHPPPEEQSLPPLGSCVVSQRRPWIHVILRSPPTRSHPHHEQPFHLCQEAPLEYQCFLKQHNVTQHLNASFWNKKAQCNVCHNPLQCNEQSPYMRERQPLEKTTSSFHVLILTAFTLPLASI